MTSHTEERPVPLLMPLTADGRTLINILGQMFGPLPRPRRIGRRITRAEIIASLKRSGLRGLQRLEGRRRPFYRLYQHVFKPTRSLLSDLTYIAPIGPK